MYKERKEITHGEIGEMMITSIYKWEIIYNVCHQKNGHKTNVQKIMYLKEKEKKRYISPHYIP